MILKLYIQRNIFHLPRKQTDLTDMVQETFYKRKPLVKSSLTKLYPISDIESQNIKYEKNVNVFLINLYLLVLQSNGELVTDKDITITLSDENIIDELSKKTEENLKGLSIEELEEKIDRYTHKKQNVTKESVKKDNKKKSEITFSINWVKEMDKKIRGD